MGRASRRVAWIAAGWCLLGPAAAESLKVESRGIDAPALIESTGGLARTHPAVEIAVVVIPGQGESAAALRDSTFRAGAAISGRDKLFVVSPRFPALGERGLDYFTAKWSDDDWLEGRDTAQPLHISSLDVTEAILRGLGDAKRFPKLRTVVVTGAGTAATYAQLYAIAGDAPDALARAGIATRFVIGNAETYLYFGRERPQPDGGFSMMKPGDCLAANFWPLGTDKAPAKLEDRTVDEIEARYAGRDLIYYALPPADGMTRADCGARAQGEDRVERLSLYLRYIKRRNPEARQRQIAFVDAGGRPDPAAQLAALLDALFKP